MNSIRSLLSIERRLYGAAILRILLGCVTFATYLMHIHSFAFLWGDNGVIPRSTFLCYYTHGGGSLSLFHLSANPIFEYLLCGTACLACISFTLGYRTGYSSILFWVSVWSVYMRNPYLMDGGDNVLYILAFFLMFVDCGRVFSLDARRGIAPATPVRALVHNIGVICLLLQMSVLYFISAFEKIQGPSWANGTALYYILRLHEFSLTPINHIIYSSELLVTVLTYATIFVEMAWPFLIWGAKSRYLVVIGACLLHAGIGMVMGLVWFSITMIAAQAVVLSDLQYTTLASACKVLLSRGWVRMVGSSNWPLQPEQGLSRNT